LTEKDRILKKIERDISRPVLFSESNGGSENQLKLLFKYVPDSYFKDINLIFNNASPDLLEKDKINVLWMHHFVNQEEAKNLGSKDFTDKLDHIIFNSNWNYEKFQYQFKIPENKSIVIRNAIERIDNVEKPKDKINLVYHTTPWRGLVNLLKIFKQMKLKDVELNVCSSTTIYGNKFNENYKDKFKDIFDECKSSENVNYFGYLKNEEVIKLLKKMHIYSFPSIWPETSCISAIEAMAAGCQIVSTSMGALFETCSPFASFVTFDRDFNNLDKKFQTKLTQSIDNYWSIENQELLKLQQDTINKTYSWEVRAKEWVNFLDDIKK
jgi:UDP-glucose:(glucosyl)LPS alpha-1,2-glucosyltransferase|tara:strand:- start:161 stop:1135 length:975 start_codon:yes stop_codon:yes gene_type:complete